MGWLPHVCTAVHTAQGHSPSRSRSECGASPNGRRSVYVSDQTDASIVSSRFHQVGSHMSQSSSHIRVEHPVGRVVHHAVHQPQQRGRAECFGCTRWPRRCRRWAASPPAVVLGEFCEHNDQVHRLVDMFAARVGPEAEAVTGLDSKSAAAYERHRIRLRMARLPRIYASAPALCSLQHRRRRDPDRAAT